MAEKEPEGHARAAKAAPDNKKNQKANPVNTIQAVLSTGSAAAQANLLLELTEHLAEGKNVQQVVGDVCRVRTTCPLERKRCAGAKQSTTHRPHGAYASLRVLRFLFLADRELTCSFSSLPQRPPPWSSAWHTTQSKYLVYTIMTGCTCVKAYCKISVTNSPWRSRYVYWSSLRCCQRSTLTE